MFKKVLNRKNTLFQNLQVLLLIYHKFYLVQGYYTYFVTKNILEYLLWAKNLERC